MLKRDFLDMDQLLEKWESLGPKKLPKSQVPKPVKVRASAPRKGLTAEEEITRTERKLENKLKGEDDA
jgi:hypothetical protein